MVVVVVVAWVVRDPALRNRGACASCSAWCLTYSHTVLQAIKVFADYLALAPPDQLKQASTKP